jgi:hypothetical protein
MVKTQMVSKAIPAVVMANNLFSALIELSLDF